jgi:TP901 family phage tail tape measure protein
LLGGSAFEKEANAAAASTERIGKAGKAANASLIAGGAGAHTVIDKTGTKLKKVGSQVTNLGRSLTAMGIPLAYLGYQSVKASSQFQQSMTLLSTQATMPMKQLQGMTKAVEAMAPKVGATPLALAKALYPIESIGLRGHKALDALKASAMGSAVGLDSLENTADAVTTVMSSHIKGAGGPVEAMSLMDRAIGLGKMHLADLTDSFKSGLIPMAAKFHINFKQILAMEAALTREGTPAAQVAARARLMLTSMAAPSGAGAKAMATLGFKSPLQLAAEMRGPGGMIEALGDLKRHADALNNPLEANSLIAQIFGRSRGMGQITEALGSMNAIIGINQTLGATTPGTLMQHFGQTQQTTAFKLKQAHAAFENAMIKLGDAITKNLLPLLPGLIRGLTSVVNWFGRLSPGMQRFLVILGGAIIAGGPILLFIGGMMQAAGHIATFIGWLTKSEAAMGAGGLEGALGSLRLGFLGLLGPLALFAGAVWLATNPKVSGPIGKFEDKVVGFLTGTKNFGANTSGHQYGKYGKYNSPPPGYDAFVHARLNGGARGAQELIYDKPLLDQWWATRKEPAQLTAPVSSLRGSQKFLGNIASIGGHGGMGLTIEVPLSMDSKEVARAVARVNLGNMNRR